MLGALWFTVIAGTSFHCEHDRFDNAGYAVTGNVSHLAETVCDRFKSDFTELKFRVMKDHNQSQDPLVYRQLSSDIGEIKAGRLHVVWYKNSKKVGSVWLTVDAKKHDWVLKKSMSPGEKFKRSNTQRKLVNVADSLGIKTLVDHSPRGLVATKRIRKGELIDTNMIGEPAMVKRNDKVNIIVRDQGLTIRSRGRALSTGWRAGDSVSVRANKGTETISAKVIGVKEVYVEI